MTTPKSDAAIIEFPQFCERVMKRLETGKSTYGDTSFDRPLTDLMDEIQEECMDLAGWGYVLYSRIENVRRRYAVESQ